MADIIYQRHWQRRDTAAALASINEVLYSGEYCVETDTGRVKLGDGATPWNDLPYCIPGGYDLSAGLTDGQVMVWDASAQLFKPGIGGISSASVMARISRRC